MCKYAISEEYLYGILQYFVVNCFFEIQHLWVIINLMLMAFNNLIQTLQQNNMNKTLRSSSLPQLKSLRQPSPFKHLPESIPKLQKPNRPDHLIEMGSYVIDKQQLLGRGFCSSVFRAKHTKTGEIVAVKIVDFGRIKGAVQKRLIKHQIKSLHELKAERNILRLHQVITNKQNVAFVTQICKGSLLQRLKPKNAFKKQPLSREEAFKILKQILRGYYNMREHNILHRDLKPANVLMGQDGQARLGDFGFSIRDEKVQQDKHVNIGSPLYMAPEVLKGNQYSAKADMWSIGLIFLEMLIGDLPWASVKQYKLHDKLLDLNITDVIPQDLEQKYKEMLTKCFEIDPRKRIGVMQMMKYLFTKEQLNHLSKQSKSSASQPSARFSKVSILTSITEKEEQRISSSASVLPAFDRSKNTTACLYSTNSTIFLKNPVSRSSKAASSRKMKIIDYLNSPSEGPLSLKLKLSLPQQQQSISREQMSELHLCRFLFKMVQLIAKGQDNIHNTYFNITQKASIELAQNILFILGHIRQIKSDFTPLIIRQFRKSKQFRRILELTAQFQNNYVQFFQIQLKAEIEGRLIDPDYLIESMSAYIKNGSDHFELIFEQLEKSQLKMITDDEICQFVHLIDFMGKLVHFLRLRKKGRQNFVKYSKVQELANKPLASITFTEMRKISQRLHQ